MATIENVNIEINAALKAENERLKESDLHLKKWIDELQADKEELLNQIAELKKIIASLRNLQS